MNDERAAALYEKRKNVVEAVQRGELVNVVARTHNVPLRTIFAWLARYRQGGWHALREGQRSGRPRKVSGELMQWLYQAITLGDPRQYQLAFCLWTLGIVRLVLKKEHGVELSKSAVCRLLQQMGLTPQRPIYRSYKQDPQELERYLQRTFPQLRKLAQRSGAEIYFVDESAVRSDHHRGTTWGAIGQTPVVQDSGDRFGLKLISAVSPRGDMRFAVIEGKMNSEKFIEFAAGYLEKVRAAVSLRSALKKLHADAGEPIIVIADNASYHSSGKVQKFAGQSEAIHLGYLPKYAPELNPDEQVWNHAKARLTKLFIDSAQSMKQSVLNIMRSIQKQSWLIQSFFQLKDTSYAFV
jgi:transposase